MKKNIGNKKDWLKEFSYSAELSYMKRSIRFLEIFLEEFAYKYSDVRPNIIEISRGRFETEGIYTDDIEYILQNYINDDKNNPLLTLNNNVVLKNNIKLKDFVSLNDSKVGDLYEWNKLKYSYLLEFVLAERINFGLLLDKYNHLKTTAEEKKLVIYSDLSKFVYISDFVLYIKPLSAPAPRQINFLKKTDKNPSDEYYFIDSVLKFASEKGSFEGTTFTCLLKRDEIISLINNEHKAGFDYKKLSSTRNNFIRTKVPGDLKSVFTISNFIPDLKGYRLVVNLG